MGTQITRLTRLAAAGLSAVLLFATAACAATSPAETEPDNKTSVPAPTGPINVVASLNQWGSLAAELGGDDVEVTSIVNSTNVDAHDFEPKTSDVAKLSKAQIIVANGAGYDSWATKSMTKTTNIVSAASVMGAMEGDNPHLWFSKDARSSMATAITDAYVKALPSKKKAFQKRLKAWQADEKSLESDDNVDFAARNDVAYVCPKGHRTILPFAEGAEIPDEWECRCGSVAHREGDADREGDEISKPTRTHWDMLLERRSEEELATLLEKRLQMHRDGWIPDYE